MNRDALRLFLSGSKINCRGEWELPKLFLSGSEEKKSPNKWWSTWFLEIWNRIYLNWVTQVLNKNTYLAIQIYRDLMAPKEEPIKVNAILLGQFRLLLQVKYSKMGTNKPTSLKVLKVHPYRVKLAVQQVRHLSKSPGGCFSGIGRDGIQHEDRARAEGNTIWSYFWSATQTQCPSSEKSYEKGRRRTATKRVWSSYLVS